MDELDLLITPEVKEGLSEDVAKLYGAEAIEVEGKQMFALTGVKNASYQDNLRMQATLSARKNEKVEADRRAKEAEAKLAEVQGQLNQFQEIGIEATKLKEMSENYHSALASGTEEGSERFNNAVKEKLELTESKYKHRVETAEADNETLKEQLAKAQSERDVALGNTKESRKLAEARSALDIAGIDPKMRETAEMLLLSVLDEDAEGDLVASKNVNGDIKGKDAKSILGVWRDTVPNMFGTSGFNDPTNSPSGSVMQPGGDPYAGDNPNFSEIQKFIDENWGKPGGEEMIKALAAKNNKDINGNPLPRQRTQRHNYHR